MSLLMIKSDFEEAQLADIFIQQAPPVYQANLRLAVQEIEAKGQVTSFKSTLRRGTEWSVWIPSGTGDPTNFIIYYSDLLSTRPKPAAAPLPRLGVNVERGHAQGSWVEFVPGDKYIIENFSGKIRDELLELFYEAQAGKISWKIRAGGIEIELTSENPV